MADPKISVRPLPPVPEPRPKPAPVAPPAPGPTPSVPPVGPKLAIERHAESLKTPEWLFRAAKAMRRWAQGAEVTEADFKQAVVAAGSIRIQAR